MSQTTAVPGRPATNAAQGNQSVKHSHARTGILMVLPVLVLVAIFTLYPFGHAIYESTRLSSPIFAPRFVGIDNYRDVIGSVYFLDATGTTLTFAGIVVPLLVVLGVLVALLLNEPFFGNTALRAGMLLPWAIPASVAGVIWKWIFFDSYGALNAMLYAGGIIDRYIQWLTTPSTAMMAVVVVFVWSQLPLAVVMLLAALQAVPDDLYEAAALDGASMLDRFRSITLPHLRPMLVVVALYELLMAISTFDITYSLTSGGPGSATTLLSYFTWSESFRMLDFGRGAALAIIIALASLVAILVLIRAMPKDALLDED